MGIVYKIRNIVNDKIYIGMTTKTLDFRWREHQQWAARGSVYYFHRAIRKHGAAAFQAEVLSESEDLKKLENDEILFIQQFQSNTDKGYNQTAGGDGFVDLHRSVRHRLNISKALTGIKRSSEFRAAVAKRQTGRTASQVTRDKMSTSQKKFWAAKR